MDEMALFEKAMYFVDISEGGTNNDPDDRGGKTKFGISEAQYPDLNIDELSRSTANRIYYDDYWTKNKCGSMEEPLAIVMFDTSVNCGASSAAQWLQKSISALGGDLELDGIIGPKTLAQANFHNPNKLMAGVVAHRLRRYSALLRMDHDQYKFVRGWINRVADLMMYVL